MTIFEKTLADIDRMLETGFENVVSERLSHAIAARLEGAGVCERALAQARIKGRFLDVWARVASDICSSQDGVDPLQVCGKIVLGATDPHIDAMADAVIGPVKSRIN